MELIKKNINVLTMQYPTSRQGELWREGLPAGNGEIGVNWYGGTKRETLIINHAALWSGVKTPSIPNVSGTLEKMREAMDSGDFERANPMLADALKENGYKVERSYPLPLAELNICFLNQPGFSDYLRAVNMETGEISAQYKEDGAQIKQDLFVSRSDDIIVMRIEAEKPILRADISLDMRRDCRSGNTDIYTYIEKHRRVCVKNNTLAYCAKNSDGLSYGTAAVVESDGNIENNKNAVTIFDASFILIKIKVFVNGKSDIWTLRNDLQAEKKDYC